MSKDDKPPKWSEKMSYAADVIVQQQNAVRPPPLALARKVEKPKFPQYAVYSKRTESFENWPEYLPVEVEDLVEAGLVYTGVGDTVRCYFCGGGMRNWERVDVPMEEHAKWYPRCPHILQVKGQAYVEKICRGEKPDEDSTPVRNDDGRNLLHLSTTTTAKGPLYNFDQRDDTEMMKEITPDDMFAFFGDKNDVLASCNGAWMDERKTSEVKHDRNGEKPLTSVKQKMPGWASKLITNMVSMVNETLQTATDIMALLVKRCPMLFPNMTRTPTEMDLVTFADAIGNNFDILGTMLGVDDARIDQICSDNPTTVKRTYGILKEWRENNPFTSTVESLIQTLKTCKMITVNWSRIGNVCINN